MDDFDSDSDFDYMLMMTEGYWKNCFEYADDRIILMAHFMIIVYLTMFMLFLVI